MKSFVELAAEAQELLNKKMQEVADKMSELLIKEKEVEARSEEVSKGEGELQAKKDELKVREELVSTREQKMKSQEDIDNELSKTEMLRQQVADDMKKMLEMKGDMDTKERDLEQREIALSKRAEEYREEVKKEVVDKFFSK